MTNQYIVTSVGRMIQGDLFKLTDDLDQNKRPKLNKNGEPQQSCFIGLAIPKGPEWDALWAQIWQIASAAWPGGQANTIDFVNPKPGFSWKISDGDLHQGYGTKKEGAPGHMILKCSNGYLPQVVDSQCNPIVDPSQVKKGDYFRLSITVKGNNNQSNPGIYINCHMVQHVAYGQEIISGPDANEVFGAAPVGALPPGASTTPVAPQGNMPLPAGAAPQQMAPQAPMAPVQQQMVQQQMAPQAPVAPVQQQMAPQAPVAPVQQQVPQQHAPHPQAGGVQQQQQMAPQAPQMPQQPVQPHTGILNPQQPQVPGVPQIPQQ